MSTKCHRLTKLKRCNHHTTLNLLLLTDTEAPQQLASARSRTKYSTALAAAAVPPIYTTLLPPYDRKPDVTPLWVTKRSNPAPET